jgi:hypothetical protein
MAHSYCIELAPEQQAQRLEITGNSITRGMITIEPDDDITINDRFVSIFLAP